MFVCRLLLKFCCLLLVGIVFIPALSACSATNHDAQEPVDFTSIAPEDLAEHALYQSDQQQDPSHYKLQTGDQIRIDIYGEDTLSGAHKIAENGAITLPLIGAVAIEGLSALSAQQRITMLYAEGFLVDPVIALEILHQRGVYILGEVASPGRYDYMPDMNVLNLAALAGGFTFRAAQSDIEILRPNEEGALEKINRTTRKTVLKPGDIVTIQERFF